MLLLLLLLSEENAETPLSVFRELLFLDAHDAADFGELSFVPIKRGDVDSRDLDRGVFVSGFRLELLVLCRFAILRVSVFPSWLEDGFHSKK